MTRRVRVQVNLCLLPVVVGVAIASAAELNFTWDCFAYAMGSNLAFSLRGVMTKKTSSAPKVRRATARARFSKSSPPIRNLLRRRVLFCLHKWFRRRHTLRMLAARARRGRARTWMRATRSPS